MLPYLGSSSSKFKRPREEEEEGQGERPERSFLGNAGVSLGGQKMQNHSFPGLSRPKPLLRFPKRLQPYDHSGTPMTMTSQIFRSPFGGFQPVNLNTSGGSGFYSPGLNMRPEQTTKVVRAKRLRTDESPNNSLNTSGMTSTAEAIMATLAKQSTPVVNASRVSIQSPIKSVQPTFDRLPVPLGGRKPSGPPLMFSPLVLQPIITGVGVDSAFPKKSPVMTHIPKMVDIGINTESSWMPPASSVGPNKTFWKGSPVRNTNNSTAVKQSPPPAVQASTQGFFAFSKSWELQEVDKVMTSIQDSEGKAQKSDSSIVPLNPLDSTSKATMASKQVNGNITDGKSASVPALRATHTLENKITDGRTSSIEDRIPQEPKRLESPFSLGSVTKVKETSPTVEKIPAVTVARQAQTETKVAPVMAKQKWDCPTCMVQNEMDVPECPCCQEKNPNAPSAKEDPKPEVPKLPAAPQFSFGFRPSAPAPEATPKPVSSFVFGASSSAPLTSDKSKVGIVPNVKNQTTSDSHSKPSSQKVYWKCTVCAADSNPMSENRCVSCQFLRPPDVEKLPKAPDTPPQKVNPFAGFQFTGSFSKTASPLPFGTPKLSMGTEPAVSPAVPSVSPPAPASIPANSPVNSLASSPAVAPVVDVTNSTLQVPSQSSFKFPENPLGKPIVSTPSTASVNLFDTPPITSTSPPAPVPQIVNAPLNFQFQPSSSAPKLKRPSDEGLFGMPPPKTGLFENVNSAPQQSTISTFSFGNPSPQVSANVPSVPSTNLFQFGSNTVSPPLQSGTSPFVFGASAAGPATSFPTANGSALSMFTFGSQSQPQPGAGVIQNNNQAFNAPSMNFNFGTPTPSVQGPPSMSVPAPGLFNIGANNNPVAEGSPGQRKFRRAMRRVNK